MRFSSIVPERCIDDRATERRRQEWRIDRGKLGDEFLRRFACVVRVRL